MIKQEKSEKVVMPAQYVNEKGNTVDKYYSIDESTLTEPEAKYWAAVLEARKVEKDMENALRASLEARLADRFTTDAAGRVPTLATLYSLQFVFKAPKSKSGAVRL